MATAADVPKLTTVLLEDAVGPIPFRGKAIAEIPNVPTAPAIANAIHDAVGVRLYDLPLTSERIYAALNRK
jgi:CO/xanthine dehydrogenase Mo-binding subunit